MEAFLWPANQPNISMFKHQAGSKLIPFSSGNAESAPLELSAVTLELSNLELQLWQACSVLLGAPGAENVTLHGINMTSRPTRALTSACVGMRLEQMKVWLHHACMEVLCVLQYVLAADRPRQQLQGQGPVLWSLDLGHKAHTIYINFFGLHLSNIYCASNVYGVPCLLTVPCTLWLHKALF